MSLVECVGCTEYHHTVRPVIITTVPLQPYRIRREGSYLFAFPVTSPVVARTAIIVLPIQNCRAGSTIVIANLTAPLAEVELLVYVDSPNRPQPAGYPIRLSEYQQQTLWWIPASGWMYAAGFGEAPAFARAGGTSAPSTLTFSPATAIEALNSPGSLCIQSTAAFVYPLVNAVVTQIVGDGISIIGSIINPRPASSTFTIIGGLPSVFYVNSAAQPGTGMLTFYGVTTNGTSYVLPGTVTVTLQSSTVWQQYAAGYDSGTPPPTETFTLECTCVIEYNQSVNVSNGAITLLNLVLPLQYPVIPPDCPSPSKWVISTYASNQLYPTEFVPFITLSIITSTTITAGQVGIPIFISLTPSDAHAEWDTAANFLYSDNGYPPAPSFAYGIAGQKYLDEYTYHDYPACSGDGNTDYVSHMVLPSADGSCVGLACIGGYAYSNSFYVTAGCESLGTFPSGAPIFAGHVSFTAPLLFTQSPTMTGQTSFGRLSLSKTSFVPVGITDYACPGVDCTTFNIANINIIDKTLPSINNANIVEIQIAIEPLA